MTKIVASIFSEGKNQNSQKVMKNASVLKLNKEISEHINQPVESPISSLSFRFEISSSIATPKTRKSADDDTAPNEERCILDKLINDNNDMINSPKARSLSHRRLSLAPQNINFDLKAESPLKEDENESFYQAVKLFDDDCEDSNDLKNELTEPIPLSKLSSDGGATQSNITTSGRYIITSNGSSRLGNGFKLYDSISYGSNDSTEMEDEYLELMEMENLDDEDAQMMPDDLQSLLCKEVKTLDPPDATSPNADPQNPVRTKIRRMTSLFSVPDQRHCLATIDENVSPFSITFKRPDPPTVTTIQSKRHKGEKDDILPAIIVPLQTKRPPLRKTLSMNDASTIMDALSRSSEETDLIGDFSKSFCLPYVDGRHKDLRSISSLTMRQLLLGKFNDAVSSFKIIDCRYPYEYEGGHIIGAMNLYTQELIIEELINKKQPNQFTSSDKRQILIFHCEFSSERGPKLSRFLRNHDRESSPYPTLQYPEIYLLHGGYKEFYQANSDLCEPRSYRTMLDSNYSNEYRHFRAKSKSWAGDGRTSSRLSKSRSRLVL